MHVHGHDIVQQSERCSDIPSKTPKIALKPSLSFSMRFADPPVFLHRYVIYSLDWSDEQKMLEILGPNYQQRVGDCLADYYSVLNQ